MVKSKSFRQVVNFCICVFNSFFTSMLFSFFYCDIRIFAIPWVFSAVSFTTLECSKQKTNNK